MKILIASDSFKHALSSEKVGQAIKSGLLDISDNIISIIPISDGGEGFLATIMHSTSYEEIFKEVHDPLFRIIQSSYLIIPHSKTAIIELASSSGIQLISKEEQNPLITTSYGAGELIKDAILKGCQKIILGVGGSATIDGGAGITQALGFQLLDDKDKEIPIGGGALNSIRKIDLSRVSDEILNAEIIIASDVENPLLGKTGAAQVFGPQKGATAEQIIQLENNLSHFAEQISKHTTSNIKTMKGAGAAGGIATALYLLPKTKIVNGFNWLSEYIQLEEEIRKADIIITGEGRMDAQSISGKVPSGIARLATKHNKKLIGVCGQVGEGYEKLYDLGFSEIIPLQETVVDLEKALKETQIRLIETGRDIGRKLL
ncbi:MAG: glycerate kinase [Bacteroidales bacterium]|nr:glycerate kinase [Bacteroidales bacterium]